MPLKLKKDKFGLFPPELTNKFQTLVCLKNSNHDQKEWKINIQIPAGKNFLRLKNFHIQDHVRKEQFLLKKDQIKIVRNVLFAKFGSRKSREVEVRV